MSSPNVGYGVSACGCLLTLLAGAVSLFGAFHVFIDPRGKISRDEAAPALGGGVCCGLLSLVILGVGIFLVMQAKKASAAANGGPETPPAPPGAPPQ